ncbi:MAG: NADH-quinone oxidoreductase subunit J [Planctomycetota bacterium]
MNPTLMHLLFSAAAIVAAVSAVLVVTRRNAIYSAMFLIIVFAMVAIEFLLLHAEFLGFMQLLVYAGAIMVLYLFVIMLINPREGNLPEEGTLTDRLIAGGVAFLTFGLLITAIQGSQKLQRPEYADLASMPLPGLTAGARATAGADPSAQAAWSHGGVQAFGYELFTRHLLVFEVISVLVMVAIVGAVHFSSKPRRSRRSQAEGEATATTSGPIDAIASAKEHSHV